MDTAENPEDMPLPAVAGDLDDANHATDTSANAPAPPIAAVPASIPATRPTAIAMNTINTESTGRTDRAESAAAGIDTAAAAPTGAAAPGTATPPISSPPEPRRSPP